MRLGSLLTLTTVVGIAACHRLPAVAASTGTPQAVRVATATDTAFVRRICFAPDSVLAGSKPCYERVQKSQFKVF